jgi:hypothetical protein
MKEGRKVIKSLSDDTKGVIKTEEGKKKYQMGNQKIPNGQSEDTKWVIRRYQMGNQKIQKA